MFEHKKIQKLDDFFLELNNRREKGVYFYRINGLNEEIRQFISQYYETARLCGVVIEGKLPNPDEKNLAYYSEIMGMDFQLHMEFILSGLKKWLPRMNDYQRKNVAASIYDSLVGMKQSGKTDNILRNAYIKFMCWLYYKFERIVNCLGEEKLPKILYEGTISRYELMLFSVLSKAGCDIVLLQYEGDAEYLKLDTASVWSDNLQAAGMQKFPSDFCLKRLREEWTAQKNRERLYGIRPKVQNCTNAWIEGKIFDDIRRPFANRGNDERFFYNCFCRINGVEEKLTYEKELYQLQSDIKNSKRNIVIVDREIAKPTMEEIRAVHRKNYEKPEQVILDLSANIQYIANIELQRMMTKAFVDVMLQETEKEQGNVNKLTNRAVYLLCWLKRYQSMLFSNWKMPEISCFFYMGGCKDENEALFMRFLARLPVDVLILNPNLNETCCLRDRLLYEKNDSDSLEVLKFPQDNTAIHLGTAAYHAERELDSLMYQDSGMYRNQQYARANAITLHTMYEEIALLWKEELKYRPNFSTQNGIVNMPVIFAKVSGVKDGLIPQYWSGVKNLITEDTVLIRNMPYVDSREENPMKPYATEFLKNGKVQRQKIKEHAKYPYHFLREEMQDYMLEKLQALIDRKIIKGTFENGTEYTIVSVVLNLKKEIIRLIQKFDFTKTNPKLLYLITGEQILSLEDSILAAYLNLLGFDIVFFVPTGYQCVEKYFRERLIEEHQIGEYMYDLRIPNWNNAASNIRHTWRDKIFKRG